MDGSLLRSDTKYIFRDVRVEFGLGPLKKGKSMFRNRTVQITITSFLFQIKLSTSLIFNSCFVRSGIRQKGQGTARSGVNFYNSFIIRPGTWCQLSVVYCQPDKSKLTNRAWIMKFLALENQCLAST